MLKTAREPLTKNPEVVVSLLQAAISGIILLRTFAATLSE
jgi:hypothetical protein